MKLFEVAPGMPVILYLHSPKEKMWGLLVGMLPSGIVIRGLDLATFDDWMRQEAAHNEEPLIGLSTIFYPMHRIERMERDETAGAVVSYSDRFAVAVGRTVQQALGVIRDLES
jgi:hypothetical protein